MHVGKLYNDLKKAKSHWIYLFPFCSSSVAYCRSVLRGKYLGFANAIDWSSTLDHYAITPGVSCTIIIATVGSAYPKRCNGESEYCTWRVTVWCWFAQWLPFLKGWLSTLSESVLYEIVISWNNINRIPHSFSKILLFPYVCPCSFSGEEMTTWHTSRQ